MFDTGQLWGVVFLGGGLEGLYMQVICSGRFRLGFGCINKLSDCIASVHDSRQIDGPFEACDMKLLAHAFLSTCTAADYALPMQEQARWFQDVQPACCVIRLQCPCNALLLVYISTSRTGASLVQKCTWLPQPLEAQLSWQASRSYYRF